MMNNLFHIFLILVLIFLVFVAVIGLTLVLGGLITAKPKKRYDWYCYHDRVFDFKDDD